MRTNLIIAILLISLGIKGQNWPPMKFSCGKTDTVYIGIAIDDETHISKLTINCTKHKHKENWRSITIGFVNGEELVVYNNDGEYLVLEDYLLRSELFEYILFNHKKSSTGCLSIRTKDYFIKFFKLVQK